MNPEMQIEDIDDLVGLTTFTILGKPVLVLMQKRGSVFVYELVEGTDVQRAFDGSLLPPTERFRWHSCLETDGFCNVQYAT